MKIVVLDGHTLKPSDLSWKGLKALGECTIYDRTPASATFERAQGAEIVLTNKTVLSAEAIQSLKALRYVSILATGYNIVDNDAAKARGIPVSNIPTYGTESVAQMVFAHVLNLIQNVAHHAQTVSKGRWSRSPDFCYWDTPLVELHGYKPGSRLIFKSVLTDDPGWLDKWIRSLSGMRNGRTALPGSKMFRPPKKLMD